MTCICLVIRPGRLGIETELPASFEKQGIRAVYATQLRFGQELLAQVRFDAILMDDPGGHECALAWLAILQECGTPIILLRAAFSVKQEVELLQAGASEVVDCGAPTELIALKIAKAAKGSDRAPSANQRTTLRVGRLELNPQRLVASLGEVPLALTLRQFDLLFVLALRAGQFVHRSALEGRARLASNVTHRGIDMQISRIRKSLRASGGSSFAINSVYRYGYCLTVGAEESVSIEDGRPAALVRARRTRFCADAADPAKLKGASEESPIQARLGLNRLTVSKIGGGRACPVLQDI